ncbi:tetratricopeptide repeat protein [Aliivibrio sp. S4TY2]|uniref:tetratricopeptide repeat protein n=1 Tax=unclassified Aliivibrio TaxID=2645654 RepID=UPI002379B965|nr:MULTISPECIES: tetratricopeptide repeat protein [unclassified Aliivibrio]MDD9155515.1 tetratricopeptide repeat protein [Aliivibrio sp. S4TY2]MDD9160382.1 tetratricopeptide repeat protein [Aliivibrio sp. S4TY1]MDD9164720.1 tetratricopeptide repeat protein [Aliivibrio sp. S4MY2]MDD9168526.1 tetratricopeptide repeat protein [Aliivibrio sp. S4MY4]MDD9185054.1 tetratricopeptide repeat protein [Aliivibrio sp. S4MY3]
MIWHFHSVDKKRLTRARCKQHDLHASTPATFDDEADRQDKINRANSGNITAQLALGADLELIVQNGAIKWYLKAAEKNSQQAFYALVRLYDDNYDDPEACEKSKYWAARLGDSTGKQSSTFILGKLYLEGLGCEKDIELGLKTITTLALNDHLEAQLFLAQWYQRQQEGHPEGFYWMLRAAYQDDPKAMVTVSSCYYHGIGVKKDIYKAIYWTERGGELKSPESQYRSAQYNQKVSSSHNAVAYIWAYLSAANGHEEAHSLKNDLEASLPLENLLTIQNVARKLHVLMDEKPVKKHSVIRLLNKFYVRENYLPTEDINDECAIYTS